VFFVEDADPRVLEGLHIAIIGYGNQGNAQANNLRDSGYAVTIGNRDDEYRARAREDRFTVREIPDAVAEADVVFVLIPDEEVPEVYRGRIRPFLKPKAALVFASGYSIASGGIEAPPDQDLLLIAPRMIGVGVRERFLSGEGFHCFIGIERDASGQGFERLLALTRAIGGLRRGAVRITFRQEVTLDLFTEQAFGPAFGRVLISALEVLIEKGIPPEAALVELYLSEELAHSMHKMAQVGLIKQLDLHSTTSQYGALSRGIRFLRLGVKEKMLKIYEEIESGAFFAEWKKLTSRLAFRALKLFARRHPMARVEQEVRRNLRIADPELHRPIAGPTPELHRPIAGPTPELHRPVAGPTPAPAGAETRASVPTITHTH